MFSKSESVFINASPEAVYDYVSDIARHPEWAHDPVEIDVKPEPQGNGGTSFEYVTHFMGSAAGKGIVTQAERPTNFTYECEDKDGHYRWTFAIKAEGTGTRLSHTFWRLKAPLYFRILQPVMYPFLGKKMLAGGVHNIKAKMEAQAEA